MSVVCLSVRSHIWPTAPNFCASSFLCSEMQPYCSCCNTKRRAGFFMGTS